MKSMHQAIGIGALLVCGCQGSAGGGEAVGEAAQADRADRGNDGRRLFDKETFGGNGRTCRTCHSAETGTLSPADVQALYAEDPDDPLFLADGSDDGQGNGTSRIRSDATILITLPLPPNLALAGDPTARTITVRRGIPTTLNTPALDPVLMYDGREPNLESQALDAIHAHAQSTVDPTPEELQRIAAFEQTDGFFTSDEIRSFARGGPPPPLPDGNTDSEKRGRRFFLDVPIGPGPRATDGMCAICHSGPLLNTSNGFNPLPVPPFFVPKGTRFQSVLVAELNEANNPVLDFVLTNPDGTRTAFSTPDPGVSLTNGDFLAFPFGPLNNFKIPSLRNIRNTAPYFHDGSAKTLEDVLRHYATFFLIASGPAVGRDEPIVITDQDQEDAIAYLKLL
jgi:cytochrome c peroxidase